MMKDLPKIKGAGKLYSLALAQSIEQVSGIRGWDNVREILIEGSDVGQRPLVRVDAVVDDECDVFEVFLANAFTEQKRNRGQGELWHVGALGQSAKCICDAVEVFLHCVEVVRGSGFSRNLSLQKELEIVPRLNVDATQFKYFVEVARPRWGHNFIRLQGLVYPALQMDARGRVLRTRTSYLSRDRAHFHHGSPMNDSCHLLADRAMLAVYRHHVVHRATLLGESSERQNTSRSSACR
jgi:hypothetical protein